MNFLNITLNFTGKFLLVWIATIIVNYLMLVLIGFKNIGRTLEELAQGCSKCPCDAL
jgi:hypothetical protein